MIIRIMVFSNMTVDMRKHPIPMTIPMTIHQSPNIYWGFGDCKYLMNDYLLLGRSYIK